MGAFFHAVRLFFDHLAAVRWAALGIALGLHVAKLWFRAIAWRNILRAAYPKERIRLLPVFGAYIAGVGVNSVAPARGGDVVKLYLVHHRISGSRYATLASTLVVETLFDFVVAGMLMAWALAIGVLPTHQVYSRIPTVDWKWFVRHELITLGIAGALVLGVLVGVLVARERFARFRERFRQGFAILGDFGRFLRQVVLWQAASWFLRIASLYFFLEAFRVHASIHNALLVQVVESLATLFPATPGGAGTKQGLLVFLFRGKAYSRTLLLSFSVGMNIATVVTNLVLGLTAIAIMARTLSWSKLRKRGREEQTQAT
jgi:glycosyltransferase 2 family protein